MHMKWLEILAVLLLLFTGVYLLGGAKVLGGAMVGVVFLFICYKMVKG